MMTGNQEENKRSTVIAAAIILLLAGVSLYYMPVLVLWLAGYSPYLGVAAGAVIVCGFFIIFWIRSRYQKR